MSTDALAVSNVRFTPTSSAEVRRGVLGWVAFELPTGFRIDGIVLRRSHRGDLVLGFPGRRGDDGRRHPYFQPMNEEARRWLEAAVIGELRRQGNLRE